jgi:hypothetical protein
MTLGMSVPTFIAVHVIISLIGIFSGLIVLFGMFQSKKLEGLTALFLATTILTSVTGFMIPADHLLPSHIVGAISLVVLAIALLALYGKQLAAFWRGVYVATAVIALYLNVFVLVVQSFLKIPSLHEVAPTGSEPPFKITQLVVLAVFIGFGIIAVRSFRPAAQAAAIKAAA